MAFTPKSNLSLLKGWFMGFDYAVRLNFQRAWSSLLVLKVDDVFVAIDAFFRYDIYKKFLWELFRSMIFLVSNVTSVHFLCEYEYDMSGQMSLHSWMRLDENWILIFLILFLWWRNWKGACSMIFILLNAEYQCIV